MEIDLTQFSKKKKKRIDSWIRYFVIELMFDRNIRSHRFDERDGFVNNL
jgi:hypothetical protein